MSDFSWGEHTIVPLPLIFRPDLETAGFWSAETDDSSFSTLKRSNFKVNTYCNYLGIQCSMCKLKCSPRKHDINLKLTALFYLPEMACPAAAGSGSRAPAGFPPVGQQASLSSHSAPSLPPLHSPPPASLFPQDCESFSDTMQNNTLLCKESVSSVSRQSCQCF